MYTQDEINERGKLHFQMTVVKWIVGFGIVFPILMAVIMYIMALATNNHPKFDDVINVLSAIYLSPLYLCLMIVSTPLMGLAASKSIKKKMIEENSEEERMKREEHYQKIEELLEKVAKDKDTL